MPLSLFRLRTFRLSAWLVGCNLDAGGNAGACTERTFHSDVTILRDKTGDRVRVTSHTGSAQRFVEIWTKLRESRLDTGRRRSTFGARRREANLRPMGDRSRWGPNELDSIDYVSLPYVETFNSKLMKRFRTWTRSRYVFSNIEMPMFFLCSIVMNIICPFRT